VNENYTEILSHPSQNSCHQENKQWKMAKMIVTLLLLVEV
jgi:hypothetical protein